MLKRTYLSSFIVVLVLTTTCSLLAAEPNLKEIMQGLRNDTVEILDGLLTEDLGMVANGAAGVANHARIPVEQVQLVAAELGAEMGTFKQMDMSVHDLSLSIAAAAEAGDRERAIADYEQMLNGCLACHAAYKDRVATVLSDIDDSD